MAVATKKKRTTTCAPESRDHPEPSQDHLLGDFFFDPPKRPTGKRNTEIALIQDKQKRGITFSKRRAGLMKKVHELNGLTGSEAMVLVVSEGGEVHAFTTPKMQAFVVQSAGRELIQRCLNAPEAGEEGPPPRPAAPGERVPPIYAPPIESGPWIDLYGGHLLTNASLI